jgi:hypothetical protein
LVGVAVKVTELPLQVVWLPEVMARLTDGVNEEPTVMDILLLVAVVGLAQLASLVIIQVTALLLTSVVLV